MRLSELKNSRSYFIIKQSMKLLVPKSFRAWPRELFSAFKFLFRNRELERILNKPRFVPGAFERQGKTFFYVDGPSFYFMFKEIFETEIYKIDDKLEGPYILDCGANIGLAAIYFCLENQNAEVVCFEPDKDVLSMLRKNIDNFGICKNVTIVEKGLWKEEGVLEFYSEGADGGRIKSKFDNENLCKIEVAKLSSYITKRVDFLKIDIEGAEYEVLKEIEDKLGLIDRIFIEYHSFVKNEQYLPELLSILKKAGFRLNINSPGLKSRSPFYKIATYNNMDMQLNIYGVRE